MLINPSRARLRTVCVYTRVRLVAAGASTRPPPRALTYGDASPRGVSCRVGRHARLHKVSIFLSASEYRDDHRRTTHDNNNAIS